MDVINAYALMNICCVFLYKESYSLIREKNLKYTSRISQTIIEQKDIVRSTNPTHQITRIMQEIRNSWYFRMLKSNYAIRYVYVYIYIYIFFLYKYIIRNCQQVYIYIYAIMWKTYNITFGVSMTSVTESRFQHWPSHQRLPDAWVRGAPSSSIQSIYKHTHKYIYIYAYIYKYIYIYIV